MEEATVGGRYERRRAEFIGTGLNNAGAAIALVRGLD